jgi:type IV pilus assembly protein PilB
MSDSPPSDFPFAEGLTAAGDEQQPGDERQSGSNGRSENGRSGNGRAASPTDGPDAVPDNEEDLGRHLAAVLGEEDGGLDAENGGGGARETTRSGEGRDESAKSGQTERDVGWLDRLTDDAGGLVTAEAKTDSDPEPPASPAPNEAAQTERAATGEDAHHLAPRVPTASFAKQFAAATRTGSFAFDAGPTSPSNGIDAVADAGLLPGLDRFGSSSADGYTTDETPVPNISTDWSEPAAGGDGAAESEPEAPAEDLDTGDRVVSFLLRSRLVRPEQVKAAQRRRQKQDASEALWRILARGNDVDRSAVFAQAARVYAFPAADLEAQPPEPKFTRAIASHFSEKECERLIELSLAPWRVEVDRQRSSFKLFLISHDPARPEVHRLAHSLDVDRVELQYAPEDDVHGLLAEAFPQTNEYWERIEEEDQGLDLGASYEEEEELIDEEALEAEISRSKLINLFEATLVEAVREGASDIHIFPTPDKEVEIRFRTDGRLHPWHTETKVHPEALLAVIKDNSMNVDRFEKDAAQDGFIQRHVDGALIRFRVSIMPIASAAQDVRAESIVIRVLDDRKVITDLSKLGLQERALDRFRHAINQPHGMVIMTGPTGSGKSTTLVAALHEVVSPEVNVLTVEDPVEYVIEDVRQIKLSHKLKLEDALRSILRHDPDVVMVGEMRDRETAELAIKLANTGHLTFSTLHTNDAPSAVSRLYKMKIEPFLIAYAINLVVAQRLIRTLCPNCKQVADDPDPVMLDRLGFSEEEIATAEFYTDGDAPNCPTCNGFGYKGRRAISEALYFSREIRHMIVEAGETIDEDGIRQQAISEGMFTLQGSARQVVKSGETSPEEMRRVVASES